MRHQKPYRKLSRQRSHYRALMRNMALSLFEHERIRTTLAKAKEVRPFIDKIISLAKTGDLHSRRRAVALMGNKRRSEVGATAKSDIVGKVFSDIASRLKANAGGYTRIIRLQPRPGDAAPMAFLELIIRGEKPAKKSKATTEEKSEEAATESKPKKKKKAAAA